VPEDKYPRFGELNKHVFTPAIEEINFLVPQFSIKLDFQKRNRKVAFVTLTWWRKSLDEYNLARRELDRPKVGRKARQKGEVVGTL
jgi:Initiator Rep protein, WH2